jgi:hypothetical protein
MDEPSEQDLRELAEYLAGKAEKERALAAFEENYVSDLPETQQERASRLASAYAKANGGLGIYLDRTRDRFVIRMPAGTGIRPGPVDVGGVEVIIEPSTITQAVIDAIEATIVLHRWHPEARGYTYGFGYDAEKDAVSVGTDAPPEVVEPLLAQHPRGLEIHHGRATRRRPRR